MSKVEITVLSDLAKSSEVDLGVQNLRLQERWFRAAKRAAAFFIAAVLSVFIPAMHFFLVPSFLLLSAYSLVSQSRLQNIFVPGNFKCPACETEMRHLQRHSIGP